ncbi:low affinity iron permease family protein [Streptomyces humi]|uniref:low affinity iron permease family protein n=1 Tax=Streptomyces humi TaxID=1428620 RepID=UPI00069B026C|nr:low affinity iron permease family protein [Streptomyces humi]
MGRTAPGRAVSVPHPAERSSDGRGWFENLAEAASNFTSSAPFYGFCLLLVALFAVAHIMGLPLNWQLFVGDVMTSVNLLLLALLKNSERRAEHAIQRKLDSIAAALLDQQEAREQEAREQEGREQEGPVREGRRRGAGAEGIGDDLRDAIRMEEEL